MNSTYSHVPPGFRFHPTDEELVDYYLRKKITSTRIDLDVIKEVDLYKIEPWDLQEICKIGRDEQNEWYFFSHKDKKYPTGTRTNRATAAGFWKATGRDKAIFCNHELIGMRKTLVFYRGRAPNGHKSDWIMHEYRLQTHDHDHNAAPQEEGWVVCRVFKKRITTVPKIMTDHDSLCWYEDQVSYIDSPKQTCMTTSLSNPNLPYNLPNYVPCKKEIDLTKYLHLPLLASPELLHTTTTSTTPNCSSTTTAYGALDIQTNTLRASSISQLVDHGGEQVTDWRLLDKFVASQLSQQEEGVSSAAGNNGFHWAEVLRHPEAGAHNVAGKSAEPALD